MRKSELLLMLHSIQNKRRAEEEGNGKTHQTTPPTTIIGKDPESNYYRDLICEFIPSSKPVNFSLGATHHRPQSPSNRRPRTTSPSRRRRGRREDGGGNNMDEDEKNMRFWGILSNHLFILIEPYLCSFSRSNKVLKSTSLQSLHQLNEIENEMNEEEGSVATLTTVLLYFI